MIVAGALLLPLAWHVLKPYQRERLTSFMQPEADSQGSGYQVNQSLIAVGSGGIWGSDAPSQTQLSFFPVPQTDFIFAAFAEAHGFVGALGVLLLYFIVLMRLTQNAQTAPDRAGTFVVMGVVAVLSFHILVNVGMVVGLMPVTGIPLPLMSYGGSSVLFHVFGAGHCDERPHAPFRELKQEEDGRKSSRACQSAAKNKIHSSTKLRSPSRKEGNSPAGRQCEAGQD